jgi:hypothetical protein
MLCTGAFAALAGLSAPSQAIIYSSVFDPPDFFGTATFDVSPACLSSGPGLVANAGPCTVTWLSALVTLIDGPNQFTFDFAPSLLPSTSVVNSIWVQGGELAGVNSDPLGPYLVLTSPDPDLNGPWWIEFLFGPLGAFGYGVVNLYTGMCADVPGRPCVRNPDPVSVADVEGFFRVPEPSTALLLLLAAVTMGWTRASGRALRVHRH